MKKGRLLIIGAGGQGRVAADIAELNGYEDIVFLDDHPEGKRSVVGPVKAFLDNIGTADFFVAIGNNEVRKRIFNQIKEAGGHLVTLVHPGAVVARTAVLGDGVIVMAGAVVGVDAIVRDGGIINTCASVDHDCVVEEFSHVSVGTHLSGATRVGALSFVGAGVTMIQDVCPRCIIGAGAVVSKPITESGTYVGIPARKIK